MIKYHSYIVIFLCALFLSSCATVPYTDRKRLLLTSQQEEKAMGITAWKDVLGREKLSKNKKYTSAVTRVGRNIAKVSGHPEYKWEFKTFESKQANAFCLPGGKVAVYTGIFKYIDNDDELAAVMGHEIGHAIARHGGERVSQGMLQQLGAEVVNIATKEKYRDNALLAYGISSSLGVMLPYSRTQEYEADHIGILLMAKAGYNPKYAITFWEKFSTKSNGGSFSEYFSTHPIGKNRINKLKLLLPEATDIYKKSLENNRSY